MANAKQVHIEATVPYNWASELTDQEARTFAAYFLAPSGLKLGYTGRQTMIPLPNGGQLSMHRLTISGVEAVWTSTLILIVKALRRQSHAVVHFARQQDLDNQTDWLVIDG